MNWWEAYPLADDTSYRESGQPDPYNARATLAGIAAGTPRALDPLEAADDVFAGLVGLGTDVIGTAGRLQGQQYMDILAPVAEAIGIDVPSPESRARFAEANADDLHRMGSAFERAASERDEGLQGMAQAGARNLLRSMPPAIVAGRAGPYSAIAPAVATTYSQALTEGKDAGLKGDDLKRFAAEKASWEGIFAAAFQKLGLGGTEAALAGQSIKRGLGKAARDALLQTGGEFTEETAIALKQAATDVAYGVRPDALDPANLEREAQQLAVTTLMGSTAAQSPGVAGAGLADRARGQQKQAIDAARQQQQAEQSQYATPENVQAVLESYRESGNESRLTALATKQQPSREDWTAAGLPPAMGRSSEARRRFADTLRQTLPAADALPRVDRPGQPTPVSPPIEITEAPQGAVPPFPIQETTDVQEDQTQGREGQRWARVLEDLNLMLSRGPTSISDGKWTYMVREVKDDKVFTKGGRVLPLDKVLAGEYQVAQVEPFPAGPLKPTTPRDIAATQTDPQIHEQVTEDLTPEPVSAPPEPVRPEAPPVPETAPAERVEAQPETAAKQEAKGEVDARIAQAFAGYDTKPVRIEFKDGVASGYLVTLPNGKSLVIDPGRDEIVFDAAQSAKDWGVDPKRIVKATGKYRTGLIELVKDFEQGDIAHEKFHALFDLVLTDKQKAAVLKRYGTEEKAAEAYRRRSDTKGLFDKLYALADKITTAVAGDVMPKEPSAARPATMEHRGPSLAGMDVPVSMTPQGKPVSEHDIVATIAKDFGVPIRKGHMAKPKNVAGIYKVLPEVVRTRGKFHGDLAVVAHEVGHHIDKSLGDLSSVVANLSDGLKTELKKLDYDPSKQRTFEGFAEYIRLRWTTDDAQSAAPQFDKWFDGFLESRPDLQARFDRAKKLISQWRGQGASARARAQRQSRGWRPRVLDQPLWEQVKDAGTALRKRLRFELADRFAVIHDIDKEVLGAGYDAKGDATAGQLAAAYNMATAAHTERALFDGVHTVSKNHRVLGKGLKDAFKPLEQGEYEDWADYHIARHVVDVNAKIPGYNPGMRKDDAQFLVDQVKADEGKYERFEQVSQALVSINNDRIKMLVDAGVLSPEDAEKMLSKWGDTYTSLRRIKPTDAVSRLASSVLEITQPVRRRTREGSSLPIMDPVEATILNLQEAYDSALKQQVMVKLAEETIPQFGGVEGMGEFVELLPAGRKATTGTVEEILDSLTEAGFDPDLIKEIKLVAQLRRGEVSAKSLQWLADRYGVDPASDDALDDLIAKTTDVPDAETAIALWRPEYSPNKNERIIRVVLRGAPRMIQLSPELYDALQGMNPIQVHPMLRILQTMTRLTKLGATSLNVGFAGANVLADYPAFLMQTKHTSGLESYYLPIAAGLWNARAEIPQIAGEAVAVISPRAAERVKQGIDYALEAMRYVPPIVEQVAGKRAGAIADRVIAPFSTPSQAVELWNEFGGKISTRLGVDKTTLRNVRGDITGAHGVSLMERASRGVDALRDTIGLFEAGPRVAEFVGYLKEQGYDLKGGKLIDRATGKKARPPRGVLIGATLAARDVTTDFTRAGRGGRFADQFLAFFNAAVQSNIKFARTLKEIGTGQKNWKQRAIALSVMASGALVYAILRSDDDDYREQPSWLKRRYWTYGQDGQTWYRVRKPHDWAIISNLMEQFVAMWKDTDPDSLAKFTAEELHARNPADPTSLSGMPFVEAGSNYSFFRRGPIENQRMQDVAPEHRAYPWTSPAAKFVGYYTGKTLGWGPAKIDYVLNETSGGLWGRTAGAGNIESAAQKWTGASAFVLEKDYPEAVEEFYDELGKAALQADTAKFLGKEDAAAAKQAARFGRYADLMKEIRAPVRQESDRGKRFDHEKYIVGLARHALGREELDSYPNPFTSPDLPPPVQKVIDDYIGSLLMAASEPDYQRQDGQTDDEYAAKQSDRQNRRQTALDALQEAKVDKARLGRILTTAAQKRGYGVQATADRYDRIIGKL